MGGHPQFHSGDTEAHRGQDLLTAAPVLGASPGRGCLSSALPPPPLATGSMCNVNIDECAGNPCHHGGTCEDGINSFMCRCPEGYHGPTCLSEVNECSSNPCIHGACRDSLNG